MYFLPPGELDRFPPWHREEVVQLLDQPRGLRARMGEEGAGPPSAGDAGSEPGGAEEAWTLLSVREHGAVAGGRA